MTQVLDHGEVILQKYMAGDIDVVGAARVSKGTKPEDASKGEKSDRGLINHLMTSGHGTPFEHSVFRFWIAAPIFVLREWHRHRIASINEQSGRYGEYERRYYVPDVARVPHPTNKQSSVVDYDPELTEKLRAIVEDASQYAFDRYEEALGLGIARELARIVMPINTYSRMWWTINARSLMNFLELRNAPDAQWEIAEFAKAMEDKFKTVMPWTHEAFEANGRKAP